MNDVLKWLKRNTIESEKNDVVGYRLPKYREMGTMTDMLSERTFSPTSMTFDTNFWKVDPSAVRGGIELDQKDLTPDGANKNANDMRADVTNVRSLYVKGKVEGLPVDLLIDTGADVTVISKTFLQKMPKWSGRKWEKPHELHAVDGSVIKAWGPVITRIELCGRGIDSPVYTADVMDPVVLGLPTLRQLDAVLDLSSCELRIGEHHIPCQERVDRSIQRISRVTVARGCVVPPWSEQIVSAKLSILQTEPAPLWLVDDPGDSVKLRQGLIVARTLENSHEGGRLLVRIANLSSKPISLKKGKLVAKAVIVQPDDVVKFTTREKPKNKLIAEIPEHLKSLWEETCNEAQLDDDCRQKLADLLCRRQGAFAHDDKDIGETSIIQHDIDTEGAVPIKQQPRRPPVVYTGEVEKQVQDLLENRLIEPSTSPWASPVVLVKKKDGSVRFCIDYRQLNAVSRKDAYPLPRIDETLESLRGAMWFSTLDLLSGYWQVGMTERAKQASAFVTRGGLFQWRVMPFGLCNAPATFERLMEAVLRGLQWSSCLVYLDDVVVFAKSASEMIDRLDTVLERIETSGLKLKPRKCCLFRQSVGFLGHIIGKEGVTVDPEKIKAVQEWPQPMCVKDVRAFVGFASYYRRFVKNFASIASPLHALTKSDVNFVWSKSCQEAFERLKTCLSSSPILAYPSEDQTFILDTDASNDGLGAVLSQQGVEMERPVAYASRTLTDPEKNYCATRKELLGVIFGLKQFRHYLLGRPFVLRTDHGSLQWLLRFKKPEGQIARWLEIMSEYLPTIIHRPGLKHSNADGLSRKPCKQCDGRLERAQKTNTLIEREDEIADWPYLRNIRLEPLHDTTEIHQLQENDPELWPICCWLSQSTEPTSEEMALWTAATKSYWTQRENMFLSQGLLYRRWLNAKGHMEKQQLLAPKLLQQEILEASHENPLGGHFAVQKTCDKVKENYYWYHLSRDVRIWCRSCAVCEAAKGRPVNPNQRLVQDRVTSPLERVAVDIVGPLPKSDRDNSYILVVSDYFTKFVEAYAMPNQEAKTCAKFLVEEFFCRYGMPSVLHSDQGRNFESQLFAEVCKMLEIRKTRTSPFHPQSDGLVERFNRTLKSALKKRALDEPSDWDVHIPYVLAAYRSSRHSSAGMTPNYLMFGREVVIPLTLLAPLPERTVQEYTGYAQQLRERLESAYSWVILELGRHLERQKRNYDRKVKEEIFNENDLVWMYQPTVVGTASRALNRKWIGPCTIVKRLPAGLYVIRTNQNKEKVLHGNRLRRYYARPICEDENNPNVGVVSEEFEEEMSDETDNVLNNDMNLDQFLESSPNRNHAPQLLNRPQRHHRRPHRLNDFDC